MHILVTNDDGVQAPGLLALAQAMRSLGKVTVLAPDKNWSASGHQKTLSRPLRVQEVLLNDGTPALASDGAPSDCVALVVLGILQEPVDLVVSGINPYPNVGHDLTYSGTVTAAMEAAIADLPALAVSLDGPGNIHQNQIDYGPAAKAAARIAARVIEKGLPPKVLLNVNVPYLPEQDLKGFKITRQGLRIYHDLLVRREDPRGVPYYWIGGDAPTGVHEEGTDYGAMKEGYISINPIHLDLTAYRVMEAIQDWSW
jgi:5'-nucleotidase